MQLPLATIPPEDWLEGRWQACEARSRQRKVVSPSIIPGVPFVRFEYQIAPAIFTLAEVLQDPRAWYKDIAIKMAETRLVEWHESLRPPTPASRKGWQTFGLAVDSGRK